MREKEVRYFQYLAGLFRLTQAVQQSAQQALVEAEATLRGEDCEEDLMESAGLGDVSGKETPHRLSRDRSH